MLVVVVVSGVFDESGILCILYRESIDHGQDVYRQPCIRNNLQLFLRS